MKTLLISCLTLLAVPAFAETLTVNGHEFDLKDITPETALFTVPLGNDEDLTLWQKCSKECTATYVAKIVTPAISPAPEGVEWLTFSGIESLSFPAKKCAGLDTSKVTLRNPNRIVPLLFIEGYKISVGDCAKTVTGTESNPILTILRAKHSNSAPETNPELLTLKFGSIIDQAIGQKNLEKYEVLWKTELPEGLR